MRPLVVGLVAGLVLASCGVRPEQAILDQFFSASRLRDLTALKQISTIVYEPLERGIVTDFHISKVEGEGDVKSVTAAAKVKRPDGQIVDETLVVVMQRIANDAQWKITGIVER